MKTQHTAGPWRVCQPYTNRNVFPIGHDRQDGATDILGEVNGIGGTEQEDRSNARLIAAAPELLEALEQCQRYIGLLIDTPQKVTDIDWKTLHNQARAAILKAEGDAK